MLTDLCKKYDECMNRLSDCERCMHCETNKHATHAYNLKDYFESKYMEEEV